MNDAMPNMTNYRETIDEFRWQIPERFNFAGDVVDALAAADDSLALVCVDERSHEDKYRFSDIRRLSSKLADVLRRNGVEQGDRVIVMFPRRAYWPIAMVACLRLGAIPIPCIEMLTGKDITYRVRHSHAKAAVTLARNAAKFDEVSEDLSVKISVGDVPGWLNYDDETESAANYVEPATVGSEDPVVIYYTSGSTGLPKGVTHASRALFAWRVSAKYWLDLSSEDLIWCTADTGWSKAGTSILFGPWSMGASALLFDGPFDPAQRLELLEKYDVSVYCAASTELLQVAAAADDQFDLSKLRRIVSAGEPVSPVVLDRVEKATGCIVSEAFGQTETLMTVLNYPCQPIRPGSMGLGSPGTTVDVMTDDGRIAKPGEEGQLVIGMPNPQLMLSYWSDPVRTEEAFVENDSGSWFVSGDRVHKDADGYVYYCGRDDDVIGSAGYRIGPFEVESALLDHEAVQECAVVASPDPERGAVVKAFVVLQPGHNGDDSLTKALQEHVRRTTAPYKYPRRVAFVDVLPKTLTGKVLRRALRDQEYSAIENDV